MENSGMKEYVRSAVTRQSNVPQLQLAVGYPCLEVSWLGVTRMEIKTVQTHGLTPSRFYPGKFWEPGRKVGGDQGNGLVTKLERELWTAFLGSHRLSLWDNQSRLFSNSWEITQLPSAAQLSGLPSAVASQLLPPWSCQEICDNSFYWSSLLILSMVKIYCRHIK